MKTILIVEDTKSERQLISGLLTYAGFVVAACDSAEQAWEWLNNHDLPDLILLDIVMPGESGLELCRQIRSNPNYNNIPVLFCTSKAEDFDRFWALRQGGSDYITKPFAPNYLVETVYKHLK